ncbi:hypothetical protein [Parapedobacter sp. 10938]|uniref:hypothetical protein n=1 Tax=Parapedobacter flavus TaxID=3110225 RepID=UPI002DBAB661|nr:hypothetical protein [Parapedobacter sp. 10938]MEC3878619.1 hypothetical protein [Parapedobacter sp. 10938]
MMNTQRTIKQHGWSAGSPNQPAKPRLRKIMPNEDYVDLLHERAQPANRPPGLWPLAGLLTALVATLLFAGPLLRLADPTAAVVDVGTVSLFLLAAIGLLGFHMAARALALRLYRWAYRLSGSIFIEPANEMTPWQHACVFLACYASLFWGSVALLLAIL